MERSLSEMFLFLDFLQHFQVQLLFFKLTLYVFKKQYFLILFKRFLQFKNFRFSTMFFCFGILLQFSFSHRFLKLLNIYTKRIIIIIINIIINTITHLEMLYVCECMWLVLKYKIQFYIQSPSGEVSFLFCRERGKQQIPYI